MKSLLKTIPAALSLMLWFQTGLPAEPAAAGTAAAALPPPAAPSGAGWISLFNGTNLDGWTIKIAKHPLGGNAFNTFRVEDGILKVNYDNYPKFDGRFGHLYSNLAYPRYIFRLEYRFPGRMVPGAPSYVNLNSGIMIHAQPPQSLLLNQGFPSSLEMQFLADEGKGERSTANLCTPGTNIELGGKLVTTHIIKSTAPTFAPETWVKAEVEVHGKDEVIHRINGVEALRYQRPQLDPRDDNAPACGLLKAGSPLLLSYGHIALQAEGQPVWFRNIELKPLEKK